MFERSVCLPDFLFHPTIFFRILPSLETPCCFNYGNFGVHPSTDHDKTSLLAFCILSHSVSSPFPPSRQRSSTHLYTLQVLVVFLPCARHCADGAQVRSSPGVAEMCLPHRWEKKVSPKSGRYLILSVSFFLSFFGGTGI